MIEKVEICNATLYCADYLDVLSGLAADAIVTDPPYGIAAGRMNLGKWRTSRMEKGAWDDETPDLSGILALDMPSIIWGGNYFSLPPSRAWLIWDKGAGFKGRDFAEVELAWCSFDGNARIFQYDPLARGDYRDKEHPTQKPLTLMKWCLGFLPTAGTILDPFMGSGTTGVAATQMGRRFVGVEKEKRYFDIACRRIEEALKQPDMFVERAAEPEQQGLL